MKIKQYIAGTKVSEPGCYDGIPIEIYHGDITDGPGISSSGLRTIESQTPLHYWANSYLNPDRVEQEPKSHFAFGQAAHTLLLSEDGFREKFVVRPDGWRDWRTKAAQEWRDEMQAAGKTVLVPADLKAIRHIANQLAADPLVASGILHGAIEHSMLWKDGKTGVWLRARPDVIPAADGVLVDLKTTTDASPHSVQRTVLDYNYAMQGALAGWGMEATLGTKMTDFVLVWLEKSPPYAVRVSPVDSEWLYWAQRQLRRAIDTFAKCVETNTWPGYTGEDTIHMPQWLRARFEDEDKHGLIPEAEVAA